jgi:hypothetical protein
VSWHPRRGWATVQLTPDQQELSVRTQTTASGPAHGASGRAGSPAVQLTVAHGSHRRPPGEARIMDHLDRLARGR